MNRRLAGTAIHVLALIGCSGKTPTPPTSLPPPPTSSTPTCTYAVSPLAVSTGQDGEPGTMAVQTTAGCPWTARSNTGWITVTAGNSRSGNGSLDYSVQATFDTNARTGTLTVAGMAVTVTQSAFSSSFSSPFVGEVGETQILRRSQLPESRFVDRATLSWSTCGRPVTRNATGETRRPHGPTQTMACWPSPGTSSPAPYKELRSYR